MRRSEPAPVEAWAALRAISFEPDESSSVVRATFWVVEAARCTEVVISSARPAAVPTDELISALVAVCSSTAVAIVWVASRMVWMIAPIRSIELTAPSVVRRMPSTLLAISSVAAPVWRASSFTSFATTAKPLPASPALAASMVAFSASRLVWSAMSLMTSTTRPISRAAVPSTATVWLVSSARRAACTATSAEWWQDDDTSRSDALISSTAVFTERIESLKVSIAETAEPMCSDTAPAPLATSRTLTLDSSTAAATAWIAEIVDSLASCISSVSRSRPWRGLLERLGRGREAGAGARERVGGAAHVADVGAQLREPALRVPHDARDLAGRQRLDQVPQRRLVVGRERRVQRVQRPEHRAAQPQPEPRDRAERGRREAPVQAGAPGLGAELAGREQRRERDQRHERQRWRGAARCCDRATSSCRQLPGSTHCRILVASVSGWKGLVR